VPGGFAVPATFDRVIVEGFDVDELGLEYGSELGPGDVVSQFSQMLAYGHASAARSREQ
jgi:hypothetical protein